MNLKSVSAGCLEVAFAEYGAADGWPCILGHGFPYDVHAYAETAPILAAAGGRIIVPYLRGYGPTRFLSAETPRSGESGPKSGHRQFSMQARWPDVERQRARRAERGALLGFRSAEH